MYKMRFQSFFNTCLTWINVIADYNGHFIKAFSNYHFYFNILTSSPAPCLNKISKYIERIYCLLSNIFLTNSP